MNHLIKTGLLWMVTLLLLFTVAACSSPPPEAQLRVANFTNKTLNDIQIPFADSELAVGMMLPHTSSTYQTHAGVYAELPLSFSTNEQAYSLNSAIAEDAEPLPEGMYTYVIQLVNGELQHIILNDTAPHFDEALVGYWLWTESQLVSGETVLPPSGGAEPAGMLLTKSPSLNEGLAGQLFGAYSGCNSVGGAFFTTPQSELVMHMVEFTGEPCQDGVDSAEQLILQIISGITTYTVDGDTLTITLPNGDALIFNRS